MLAGFLQSKGLKKSDRIAIMMPNLLQFPIALYGALMAGLVVVNVNPLYTARELQQQLNDAKPRVIVVFENFASTLEEAGLSIDHVIVTRFGDCHPGFKGWLFNAVVKYIKRIVPAYHLPGAMPLSSL